MAEIHEPIRQQAIDWAVATQDPVFDDWEGFTLWLEADRRHGPAYDAVLAAGDAFADLDAAAHPASPALVAANDEEHPSVPSPTRRRWAYGAIAASVLALVAVPLWQSQPRPYMVATGPGERETIELADGSRILLNGSTRLALDHHEARFARLERGEAMFEVRHDQDDPFVVESGDVRLVDAGTAFNVIRDRGALDVAVSEGVVIVNPERENVRLVMGRRAQIDARTTRIIVSDIAPDNVGGWRSGRLSYAGATLGEVASGLERMLGVRIALAPELAARPFSGVVQVARRDPEALVEIAQVLGARAVRTEHGWTLVGNDASP